MISQNIWSQNTRKVTLQNCELIASFKLVLIMMKFARAEKKGDWPLHLCAVEEI